MTLNLSGGFSSSFTITNTGSSTYDVGSAARKNSDLTLGASAVDQAVDVNNPNGSGNPWLSWLSSPLNLAGMAPDSFRSANRSNTINPGSAVFTDNTTLSYFIGNSTTLLDFNTINGFTLTLNGGSSYDSFSTSVVNLIGVVTYNYTPAAPVPEPSTMALSAIGGLGGLLLYRRRK